MKKKFSSLRALRTCSSASFMAELACPLRMEREVRVSMLSGVLRVVHMVCFHSRLLNT